MNAFLFLLTSFILGTLYGLFFVHVQRRVFLAQGGSISWGSCALFVTRLVMLGAFSYSLLHLNQIHSILIMVSFMLAFWVVILTKKA